MTKPFWEYPMMGRAHDFGLYWTESALGEKALYEKKTIHQFRRTGTLRAEVTAESLIKEACALGGWVVKQEIQSGEGVWIIASDEWAARITHINKSRTTGIAVNSTDEKAFNALRDLIKKSVARRITKGQAFIVVQGESGPYLHEMGMAGEDFIADNYRPEVVEGYRHVVADMNRDDPCGRIVILDGPPGTGKTHMVRALLNEVPKGMFVLIPSNMMSNLGSPTFIKAILREQKKGYPMILVVEDADEAISMRQASNLSEISALLNFSDGIFGAMLDIRIVATTNVDIEKLDDAVMRPGRLCRRIEVGRLDLDQAEKIFLRLTGGKGTLGDKKKYYTLGEVYSLARGSGAVTEPIKKPKRAVGFSLNEPERQSTDDLPPGLKPGDLATTDQGELVRVCEDGTLEFVEKDNPHIGSSFDEDDDLFDEDPEETPVEDLDDEDD